MPQSLLTGQLKEKPTYRVRCLYSSFVHATRVPPTSWTFRTPSSFGFSPSATRRRSPRPLPQAGRGQMNFFFSVVDPDPHGSVLIGQDPDQREFFSVAFKNVKVLHFRIFVRFACRDLDRTKLNPDPIRMQARITCSSIAVVSVFRSF
jgi:hypothetical protein